LKPFESSKPTAPPFADRPVALGLRRRRTVCRLVYNSTEERNRND